MAGASISKLLLVFKHMELSVYESRTFFYRQSRFLFPIILKYWETYRASFVTTIKGMKDAVWSGDGRFDSMAIQPNLGKRTPMLTYNEDCALQDTTGNCKFVIQNY